MKRAASIALPVALAAVGSDEAAAVPDDIFLKLEGIEGESVDPKHKDEIDVLAWSWGLHVDLSGGTGMGGGGAGKAMVEDIKIIKQVDRSSADLALHVFNGKSIPKAEIVVERDTGQGPFQYIKIELKDVLVTRVAIGGKDTDEATGETITLNFDEICVTYTPQMQDGSPGPEEETCWSVSLNEET